MIQMKTGIYGGLGGKRPADGPFSLPPEEEARLVRRGVAEYVGTAEPTPEPESAAADPGPIGFDETPEEAPGDVPEYHAGMTAKELREIGTKYGLTFRVGMTKEEMVAALDEATAEEPEEEPAEDAPTFDPAEAVVG